MNVTQRALVVSYARTMAERVPASRMWSADVAIVVHQAHTDSALKAASLAIATVWAPSTISATSRPVAASAAPTPTVGRAASANPASGTFRTASDANVTATQIAATPRPEPVLTAGIIPPDTIAIVVSTRSMAIRESVWIYPAERALVQVSLFLLKL